MAGSVSLAEQQSTDAVASLKAILKRHRVTNCTADGSKREKSAAKERDRGPTVLDTGSDYEPGTQSMPTSAKVCQDTDGDTANMRDAIYQSRSHAVHMRDRHFTFSPSLSQSEDVFTPDLSVDAVRELSLLCAGFERMTNTAPQAYKGLRDQEHWIEKDCETRGAPLTAGSLNLDQSPCVSCTTKTIPSDARSQNQFEHVSKTCSACGDVLQGGLVDPTSFARDDIRSVELGANQKW